MFFEHSFIDRHSNQSGKSHCIISATLCWTKQSQDSRGGDVGSMSHWEDYEEFAVIFSLPQSAFWLQTIYVPLTCKTYVPLPSFSKMSFYYSLSSKSRSFLSKSDPDMAEAPYLWFLGYSFLSSDPVALKTCASKRLVICSSSLLLALPAPMCTLERQR